jgi:hypothetical protein
MECSKEYAADCNVYKVDGYPTIYAFVDGVLKEEYQNQDDENHLYNYIVDLVKEHPYLDSTEKMSRPNEEKVDTVEAKISPKVQNVQYLTKPTQNAMIFDQLELSQQQSSIGIYLFISVFFFCAFAIFMVARRNKNQQRYKKVDSERETSD